MSFATFRAACRRSPVAIRQWLPGQREFRAALEKAVIWFGFNGCGKTAGLVGRLIDVFEGTDPIVQGIRRPIKIVLCVTTFEAQSAIDFADQLHALCPPGLIAQQDLDEDGNAKGRPAPWYARGKGFRGRPPRLIVQRGPLKGSTLNVTTLGSGAAAAAGGTIDLVIINEPVSREVFEELSSRDRANALGYLWYAFTPILDAHPQTWIPELVKDVIEAGGSIRFIQTRLTPEALQFPSLRRLEPWAKTCARVAKWARETVLMRSGHSLEPIIEGTYFSDVWDSACVVDEVKQRHQILVCGLDYSTKIGRTRAVVSSFEVRDRTLHAHSLVDYRAESADWEVVAAGFLEALDQAGLDLEDIDFWIGDRVAIADQGLVRRDNLAFRAALMAVWNKPKPGHPVKTRPMPAPLRDIQTPRKRHGSHWYRLAYMRAMLSSRRWLLHSRCTILARNIQRFDGSDMRSPDKDGLDAFGYALERAGRHYGIWLIPE